MKLVKQTAFAFLLCVAACAGASAQDVAGRVNVTHNMRWGTAILPAGSYLVSVHSGPVPFVTVTSSGRNTASIMAVAQYVETATCKSSTLEMEQTAAGWNVRSLCFESQVTVYFGQAEKAAQQARASAASVPEVASLSGSR
jgi:hypothetical protein